MKRYPRSAVLVAAALSAACGGGGGDSQPANAFTLSGTATAAPATAIDGDVKDPRRAKVANGAAASAQALPGRVTLGGWASATADAEDWYRATLAAGQAITLALGAPTAADLDLSLYDVADPVLPVVTSDPPVPGQLEAVQVPAAGEYYVRVRAVSGESGYLLGIGPGTAGAPPAALSTLAEFVPGEVVVRFRDDALPLGTVDTVAARAASVGLEARGGGPRREMLMAIGAGPARARAFAALGIPAASASRAADPALRAREDTLRVVKALRARPDVASADPNYVHRPTLEPNDQHYRFQWHYPLINLPQAWDVTTGDPVVVAVVDTGVVDAQPDLAGKVVDGYDFIADLDRANDGDGIDADPNDTGGDLPGGGSSWHGTHVAGTIGAATNNGAGVAGVSWGARIMPVRVLGVGGGTSFDIMQGVRWAAGGALLQPGMSQPNPAAVINLSLGCGNCFSLTEQSLYRQVRDAGVIVVAASGNENTSARGYPASYDGVISVAAVDMALARAPYSNYGDWIDLAAPGGDTASDLDGNGFVDGVLSTVSGEYRFLQGTSMAAPHVAGVVALMKSVCPDLPPAKLDELLAGGSLTTDLPPAGKDDLTGHGLVDALAAVQAAQAQCGDPVAPTIDVTPSRLDLGPGATSATLTVAQRGTGTLPVVTASDDAGWLAVAAAPPTASGLGTYTVTVDRTGLPDGIHAATVTFTVGDAPGATTVAVPVTLQQGSAGTGMGDAGYVYFLLVNDALEPVAQVAAGPASGAYPFAFAGVPAGSYYLVAGSDLDDDGFICDLGDSCGAYPTIGVPAVIELTGDLGGRNFVVGFDAALGGAAAAGVPPEGIARIPPKRLAGAR